MKKNPPIRCRLLRKRRAFHSLRANYIISYKLSNNVYARTRINCARIYENVRFFQLTHNGPRLPFIHFPSVGRLSHEKKKNRHYFRSCNTYYLYSLNTREWTTRIQGPARKIKVYRKKKNENNTDFSQ